MADSSDMTAGKEQGSPVRVKLDVDIQADARFDFDLTQTAQKVCEQILKQEHCPVDAEVSLVVTDAENVHRLNLEFRGIDRTTDVLSFPAVDYDAPADFSSALEDKISYMDPETGRLILGDIVINAQKVREQAAEYGHSELREFAFLVAHSMLHLCGYDHIDPEDAALMEPRQDLALSELGISRGL